MPHQSVVGVAHEGPARRVVKARLVRLGEEAARQAPAANASRARSVVGLRGRAHRTHLSDAIERVRVDLDVGASLAASLGGGAVVLRHVAELRVILHERRPALRRGRAAAHRSELLHRVANLAVHAKGEGCLRLVVELRFDGADEVADAPLVDSRGPHVCLFHTARLPRATAGDHLGGDPSTGGPLAPGSHGSAARATFCLIALPDVAPLGASALALDIARAKFSLGGRVDREPFPARGVAGRFCLDRVIDAVVAEVMAHIVPAMSPLVVAIGRARAHVQAIGIHVDFAGVGENFAGVRIEVLVEVANLIAKHRPHASTGRLALSLAVAERGLFVAAAREKVRDVVRDRVLRGMILAHLGGDVLTRGPRHVRALIEIRRSFVDANVETRLVRVASRAVARARRAALVADALFIDDVAVRIDHLTIPRSAAAHATVGVLTASTDTCACAVVDIVSRTGDAAILHVAARALALSLGVKLGGMVCAADVKRGGVTTIVLSPGVDDVAQRFAVLRGLPTTRPRVVRTICPSRPRDAHAISTVIRALPLEPTVARDAGRA